MVHAQAHKREARWREKARSLLACARVRGARPLTLPPRRQPYVTNIADGVTPSAQMLPRNISHNFLATNYGGGNGAVDNDDGSLWFE